MVNILMSNMSLDKKWSRIPLIKYIKPDSAVTIIGFQFYDEESNGTNFMISKRVLFINTLLNLLCFSE